MTKRVPLSPEERGAAFVALCGQDGAEVREASKRLSGDPTTTTRLLALLETQTRPEVRQGILHALAWHGDLAPWDAAVHIVADSNEAPAVRGQAAEVLAYNFNKAWPGDGRFEAATGALLAALKDPSPEVRSCAVHALGCTAHLPLLPALEAMLSDQTPVEGWNSTVAAMAAEQIEWLRDTAERRAQRRPPYDKQDE